MKKIAMLLSIFALITTQTAIASKAVNSCELGQTCSIPVENGIVGLVKINIPGPWSDPIGQFSCTYSTTNASVDMEAFPAATLTNTLPNMPVTDSRQPQMLFIGSPTVFSLEWSQPGQPHDQVQQVYLNIFSQTTNLNSPVAMQVVCNKVS